MVVTIDGPAGAGKSSVARHLAAALSFDLLDTGSMYRAVTLIALRRNIAWSDTEQLVRAIDDLRLDLASQRLWLNDTEITSEIRLPEVTRQIRLVAGNTAIRQRLNEWQRKIADGRDIVTEGRDQGSEVFPQAVCKIFLTATASERAKRRVIQLQNGSENLDFELVKQEIERRDEGDRQREVGRLCPAQDALQFCSDELTEGEVVRAMVLIVQARTV